MTNLYTKRMKWIRRWFTCLGVVLVVRLAWIQFRLAHEVIPQFGRTLKEMAILQRQEGVMLDSGRGHFIDKNGYLLTGKLQWSLVLFPHHGCKLDDIKTLAAVLHTDPVKLQKKWNQIKSSQFWKKDNETDPYCLTEDQTKKIAKMRLSHAKVMPFMDRYIDHFSGMQWLGYVAQLTVQRVTTHKLRHDEVRKPLSIATGAGGMEKTLDPLLRGLGPTVYSYTVDGHREVVPKLGTRLVSPRNPHYPLNIKTTIDIKLQHKIEKLIDESHVREGAVVILDATNADIRAMVSRPFYNPTCILPNQTECINKAVQSAVPGSIFKIVTAAAALETGEKPTKKTFHCQGKYHKYHLSCWKKKGHGHLTLEEAFAHSCNVAFAEIASTLSKEQLEQTAFRLGLGRKVGWEGNNIAGLRLFRPLDQEEEGNIWENSVLKTDEGARIQTAIGQRDTRVTPLQAANLMVTLLHQGQVRAPRLVQSVQYADGGLLFQCPLHQLSTSQYKPISSYTCKKLLHWMRSVITLGTGQSLQSTHWPVAGKSGTAQTQLHRHPRHNHWFIGYGPIVQPQYAVAVLVNNVHPSAKIHYATSLFHKIMDTLYVYHSEKNRN